MSFKGDLSTIGLAEVFQMISMAGKEGTLVVQDAESRKCIYFSQDGVQLISTGKRRGLRIGDLLVRAGKISEFRLREVLESQEGTKKLLGEALVSGGYVTERDIQEVVRAQIEEEIYDLFLWKKAGFEFIEGPPATELQEAEARATKLSFDVNALLLEAVRRVDEWAVINQKLPGLEAVVVFDSEVARQESEGIVAEQAKRLLGHLDGQSPIGEALDASGATRFEGCRIVVDLLDLGKLRLLSLEEILELGERRFGEGRRERGLRLLRAAAALAPADPAVAIRHAVFLESDGQAKAAAGELARAGGLLAESGRTDEANAHYQRAAELDPEMRPATKIQTRIGLKGSDTAAVRLEAEERIQKALARRDYARARELCEDTLRGEPENADCRLLLIRVFHESGNRKGLDEQLRYLRSHLPADREQAERIRKRLSKIVPQNGVPRGLAGIRAKRRTRRILSLAGGAVLILLLGGSVKFEIDARRSFDRHALRADLRMKDREYGRALQAMEEFRGTIYRHSPFVRKRVEEKEAQIREAQDLDSATRATAVDVQRQKLTDNVQARLASVERDLGDGNYRSARTAVDDLLQLLQRAKEEEYVRTSAAFRRRVDEFVQRAKGLERKIEDTIDRIRSARRDADQLVEQGKFRDAVAAYQKLLEQYPRYFSPEDVQFPLRIRARPDGTRIVDKRRGELGVVKEGHFDLYLRYKDLPLQLRFLKPGFRDREDVKVPYDAGETEEIVLDEKLIARGWPWTPFEQAVSWPPAYAGGAVCVASGQSLYCIGAETASLLWRVQHPKPISGPPVERGGRIFYLIGEKTLHIVDPASRAETKVKLFREGVGSPGVSPDARYVLVGSADRFLALVDLRAGVGKEVQWERPIPARLLGAPVFVGETICWTDTDGVVHAFREDREIWTYGAGHVTTAPMVAEGKIVIAREENRIVALDLEGRESWSAETAGKVEIAPVVADGAVYAVVGPTTVQRLPMNASRGWSWSTSGKAIRASPALAHGRVLLVTEDRVQALDSTSGVSLWSFTPSGGGTRFAAAPLIVGRVAYVGGSDRCLYAIELD